MNIHNWGRLGLETFMTDEVADKKLVILYSPQSNLQTDLIIGLLAKELDVECQIATERSEIPEDCNLVLIDCNGREPGALRGVAQRILDFNNDDMVGALLNAEPKAIHESLLEWPCITGIFYTDTTQDQLIRGLGYVLEGDYWVPRALLHHFFEQNRKAPTNIPASHINLTRRELQILKLIRDGATNADISKVLEVSEHTIKTHLYNTYKKIGVRNRLEASNWARSLKT